MQPQYVTNILIVEDSDLVRNMVSNYLVQLGYDVTEAVDGLTGFDLFCVNPPNILITDIQMPGMDGLRSIIDELTSFPIDC